jgi:hypothetical protein
MVKLESQMYVSILKRLGYTFIQRMTKVYILWPRFRTRRFWSINVKESAFSP